MRTALVIGTGLVGTSAALALAGRGIHVHLVDHDAASARTAAALGAGTDEPPRGRVDLAVVAVPPAHTAAVLAGPCATGWPAATWTSPASRAARAASWRRSASTSPRTSVRTRWPARSARGRSPRPRTCSRAVPGSSPDPGHRHRGAQPGAGAGRPVPGRPRRHGRGRPRPGRGPRLAHPAADLLDGRRQAGGGRRDRRTALRTGHPGRHPDRRVRPRMWVEILSANPGPVADVLAGSPPTWRRP